MNKEQKYEAVKFLREALSAIEQFDEIVEGSSYSDEIIAVIEKTADKFKLKI